MSAAGIVIGERFELEARIATGGMGEVYRARDRSTGGIAAIKILRDEAPQAHHERFAREARLLAELTHPSIVRYLAFGEASTGKPWLAMEWLDGEDLARRLKREGLGARAAVDLAARVAADAASSTATSSRATCSSSPAIRRASRCSTSASRACSPRTTT